MCSAGYSSKITHQKRFWGNVTVVFRKAGFIVSVVLVGAVGLFPSIGDGQQPAGDSTADFTQWLQEKSYERFDYGEDGELETHQLIQFGQLAPREAGCVLPVRVISIDVEERSHVKGDTELSLFVECSKPHLVANILKYVGDSDREHLEAKVIGDELAYPETPRDGMTLPDLHFTAKVKRGFLAVLGTKATMLVSERTVRVPRARSSEEPGFGTYEIHSDIGVKISVMGLSVRRTGFASHLVIDPISGPVEEILEHDDGARTVIQAVSLTPK